MKFKDYFKETDKWRMQKGRGQKFERPADVAKRKEKQRSKDQLAGMGRQHAAMRDQGYHWDKEKMQWVHEDGQYLESFKDEIRQIHSPKSGGGTLQQTPGEYHYSTPADFVLQHGYEFESQQLTEEELDTLKSTVSSLCRYEVKKCYYNASQVTLTNPEIKYVEGFYRIHDIPLQHAWNSINNKIVDVTIKRSAGSDMPFGEEHTPILGIIPADMAYFGVELSRELITNRFGKMDTGDQWTPFIDDWSNKWPLLKKQFEQ